MFFLRCTFETGLDPTNRRKHQNSWKVCVNCAHKATRPRVELGGERVLKNAFLNAGLVILVSLICMFECVIFFSFQCTLWTINVR